jgi:hypothetical protein
MGPEPKRRQALHILTDRGDETPASLARQGQAAAGDLLADLARFPPALYELTHSGTLREVRCQALEDHDYWTVAREWLEGLTRQTGLQDQLSVGGVGFWWTLNGQKFVAGLSEVGNAFAWIDLLYSLRDQAQLLEVDIYGQHPAVARLAAQSWPEAQIRIHPPAAPRPGRGGQPRPALSRLLSHLLLPARLLLSLVYLAYSLLRRPQIGALSNTNLLRPTTVGGEKKLRDIYLGDVVDRLRERGWRVALVEKHGANASWAGLAARGFFFPSDLVFILGMRGLGRLGLYRGLQSCWREKWRLFEPNLAGRLQYRGYDLSPLVLPLIRREFLFHGPDLEIMVGLWRRLLKLWKIRLLYVNDSYGRAAYPAIVAAKGTGTPTVEQQHGLIGRNHIAYLLPRDLARRAERPLCDVMAVWGEHTKHFLVEKGVYEPEQVVICGFPRIDALLGELPPAAETRARLGLSQSDPVVLYTSNGFAEDLIPDILDGIGAMPVPSRVHWLVKLHPREKTRPQWEAGARRRGLDKVRVLEGEFDFYALLAACDLHVSFASTTLIEAAVLGKPNLGLDVTHISDPAGFAQAGAFLPVRPAELGSVAQQILASAEQRERLLAEQRAFAQAWCLHDGQAVTRIVALLESLLTTAQKENKRTHVVS